MVAVVVVVIAIFRVDGAGALFWSVSVLLEAMVTVAFAVFAAMTLERAIPTVFASVGFYAFARLSGFFLGMATSDAGFASSSGSFRIADYTLTAISYLVPRLDLFGQTQWLVYGGMTTEVMTIVVVQAVIYSLLLLAAAMFDFGRRAF